MHDPDGHISASSGPDDVLLNKNSDIILRTTCQYGVASFFRFLVTELAYRIPHGNSGLYWLRRRDADDWRDDSEDS